MKSTPETDKLAVQLGKNPDGSYKEVIERHLFWTLVEHARVLERGRDIQKEEAEYWHAAYTEQVLTS